MAPSMSIRGPQYFAAGLLSFQSVGDSGPGSPTSMVPDGSHFVRYQVKVLLPARNIIAPIMIKLSFNLFMIIPLTPHYY